MGYIFNQIDSRQLNAILVDKYMNYTMTTEWQKNVLYVKSINDGTGQLSNIYIIKKKGQVIEVANNFYFTVTKEELNSFFDYVWKNNTDVKRIMFHTLLNPLPTDSSTNTIHYTNNVDNVIGLPESYDAYLESLGTQTRKHAKYYLRRIQKEFPDICFQLIMNGNISRKDYEQLISLSKQRMDFKNKPFSGNDDYYTNLYNCLNISDINVSWGGALFVVRLNDQIIAGCLGFLLGENYYLLNIAHEISYNKYNLGNVALLKTIEICIENHVKNFHFLWDKNVDYKIRFGGVSYDLHHYIVYKRKGFLIIKDKVNVIYRRIRERIKEKLRKHSGLVEFYHSINSK